MISQSNHVANTSRTIRSVFIVLQICGTNINPGLAYQKGFGNNRSQVMKFQNSNGNARGFENIQNE